MKSALKTVRGTQPHNYDTQLVHDYLQYGAITRDDAIRILHAANTLIADLRTDLKTAARLAQNVIALSNSRAAKPKLHRKK